MGGVTLLEKLYNGRGALLEKLYNIISLIKQPPPTLYNGRGSALLEKLIGRGTFIREIILYNFSNKAPPSLSLIKPPPPI
jgi:hypothetical protein